MRLLRLFFDNFVYKLIALVVAMMLWAATQGFHSVDASVDLAVEFEDQPEELVVIAQSAREVNFKVVGSRWAVRRAEQELDVYPVSLEGAGPGELRFQVDPSRFPLPRGAEISAWSPSNISVKLDPVLEKSVRVRAEIVGDPPQGFELQGVEVEPSIVPLRGASSVLTRLREVSTDRVDVSGIRDTRVIEVPLAIGRSNVWPAGEEDAKIQVLVRVVPKPPSEPLPAPNADASDDTGDEAPE